MALSTAGKQQREKKTERNPCIGVARADRLAERLRSINLRISRAGPTKFLKSTLRILLGTWLASVIRLVHSGGEKRIRTSFSSQQQSIFIGSKKTLLAAWKKKINDAVPRFRWCSFVFLQSRVVNHPPYRHVASRLPRIDSRHSSHDRDSIRLSWITALRKGCGLPGGEEARAREIGDRQV